MQENYQFIIQDNKYKDYKKIASFLFFISGLLFLLKGIRKDLAFDKIILFGAAFILFVYSAYMWFYKKKKERSYLPVYVMIIVVWILESPFWFIPLIYALLMLSHYLMEKDFIVRVSPHEISLQGFFNRKHAWNEFNNIVLKDGWLTLDLKNNKILQVEPDGKGSIINETEFNEFCKIHLNQ